MLTPNDTQKIRQFFQQQNKMAAVYVFGSMAAGRNRKKSDIDIALMLSEPIAPMERIKMETEMSNLLQKDVDLVIFDQASPLLQHQILKYGRLVYETDPKERVRQEVFARSAYLDNVFLYRKLKRNLAHG